MGENRNPPAFPVAEVRIDGMGISEGSPGMTLRDWFAGQALAGLCTSTGARSQDHARIAVCAYARADALLAARQPNDRSSAAEPLSPAHEREV